MAGTCRRRRGGTLTGLMIRLILEALGSAAAPYGPGPVMSTDKIRPHHLERKALLYVRQSSAHQVLHNRESSALRTPCGIA
jgi:hypothetical protein